MGNRIHTVTEERLYEFKAFGGGDRFKQRLVNQVEKARNRLRMTCAQVDDYCLLNRSDGKSQLPSWKEIKKNPSKMTGDIFRQMAFVLGISINDFFSPKEHNQVKKEKRWDGEFQVRAAMGRSVRKAKPEAINYISCVIGMYNALR